MQTLRILSIAAAMLAALPAIAQRLKISDYRSLVSLSSVQLSPDGTRVAFVKSVPDYKADKRVTTIVEVDVASGTPKVLTDGSKTVTSPRWSPAGDRIAFVSEGTNKADQVWVLSARGGKPKELTHGKNGVQNFAWSPRGDRLAYVTPDDDPNQAAVARHDDLFEIGDDGYLSSHVAIPSHLWVIPSAGGSARRLTSGSWSVLENAAPFVGGPSDPSWSPDGRFIAFARQENADNSDSDRSRVAVVDVDSRRVSYLSNDSRYEYLPQFSTRLFEVAYIRPHGPTPLSVMDVYGSKPGSRDLNISQFLDRNITSFAWVPGEGALVMLGNEGALARLWFIEAGRGARKLDLGTLSPYEFSVSRNNRIAFVGSTAQTPPEIYLLEGPSSKPRRLTDFNRKLRELTYAKVTEVTWTAPDGERSDGVLTYPADYVVGKKYPLVVFCHGGPEAAALSQYDGFESQFLRQPLAADGYFFFEPNYRGSDNLGNRHMHAIYRDPGVGPASDVLSGIAHLDSLGLIDPSRVSAAGHSYGGFMTAWLISHDHRWRSGVVADGAVDWRDTYNLTSVGNLAWARDSLGGSPWDPESADLYRSGSALTYAAQITTPTLILSGTADETVPITESFALFHALKERKVPVRFIGIPGAHHTPDDPVRLERFNELMRSWILQHDR